MNKKEIFILMIEGMIEKSKIKLEQSMSYGSKLYHMTGRCESREEYINDILDGTLNYYDYELISFYENIAVVKLLAKVYGGSKSWWNLKMNIKYDGNNKILECKVGMA